ncbi:hypothetical protein J6590_048102 [Homalodisca vitripennis]|nr:hypothetical protein J6590_048102 [Homalodisca vitripennis]
MVGRDEDCKERWTSVAKGGGNARLECLISSILGASTEGMMFPQCASAGRLTFII